MSQTVRTRFAPSPTGFMHIGNLRTGLYAYLFARHSGGKFILRIEDTDRERTVEGAEEMVYRTLAAAGMDYDEGPDRDGGVGPYIQSKRADIYKKYAEELVERGGAYYCFCTKERLESLGDGKVHTYDRKCRDIPLAEAKARAAAGEKFVIRQKVPFGVVSSYTDMVYGDISVSTDDIEDGILLKSDGMPTYNFANVVDDHLMGITHVIRGAEYLSSTPKYNLIYDAFGWERPNYMHLPAIMKDATRKLSKRYGDANFEDFVAKGFLPQAIVNYVALLGWCPKSGAEKMTMDEMIAEFVHPGRRVGEQLHLRRSQDALAQRRVSESDDRGGIPRGRGAVYPPRSAGGEVRYPRDSAAHADARGCARRYPRKDSVPRFVRGVRPRYVRAQKDESRP